MLTTKERLRRHELPRSTLNSKNPFEKLKNKHSDIIVEESEDIMSQD